jgi:hypothetical protein
MFTKIALLALYLRIFRPSRVSTVSSWFGIVFIAAFYLTFVALLTYYLAPHVGDGGWGSLMHLQRTMYAAKYVNFAQGVGNVITDFYVIAIPIPMVMGLHLPAKRKFGVACLFLVGLLYVIVLVHLHNAFSNLELTRLSSCACSIAAMPFRYDSLIAVIDDHVWLSVIFELLAYVSQDN